jgi:hypothetical protein
MDKLRFQIGKRLANSQLTCGHVLELLRKEAHAGTLHSRKLRSFTEPAFR